MLEDKIHAMQLLSRTADLHPVVRLLEAQAKNDVMHPNFRYAVRWSGDGARGRLEIGFFVPVHMAAHRLRAAQANKLPEAVQGSFVSMEFKCLLAFAAPWRGRVIEGAFIVSHNILECFLASQGSPVAVY